MVHAYLSTRSPGQELLNYWLHYKTIRYNVF